MALIVFSLFAYVSVLEYSYRDIVAPRFGYLGYIYREPDGFWLSLGFGMMVLTALLLPRLLSRGSHVVVWMLFVVVLVPIAQIPYFGSSLAPAHVFGYSTFAAILLLVTSRLSGTAMFRSIVPLASGRSTAFWLVLLVISVTTYSFSFAVFGFRLEIMSVFDVASTRLEYRDEVAPNVPLLGYLVSNQGNIINPLLISIGVARRRWLLVAAGTFGQLLLYSVTGYRTALLSIVVCLMVSLILRKRKSIWGGALLMGTMILAWGSVVIDRFFALGAVDLIVNRMLITAGHLTPHYLEVYADKQWHYWAYSFLGWIVEDPHELSPGFYVSVIAFGRPDIQSNANLFADGYANLGYVGVAIEASFLVFVLLLINSASRGLPMQIVLPTLILPAFALSNGSPFTAFLSFGFALAVVMFALMPRDVALAPRGARKSDGRVRIADESGLVESTALSQQKGKSR
ncbi:hypothetical protein [Paeniglutamicibacter sp.]|uniref:hypothetical protein n=1 Tax=Paeniglutamicibacter sp. TaxID=1934391 RepID=UPI00398905A3